MTEAFFEDLIKNLPSDNSFVKIRSYLTSNILDNLIIPYSDLREFFAYYYSQVDKLKLSFPDIFPFINLGFCEPIVQIIKSMEIASKKSDEFFTAFQLYLCSSLSDLIIHINPENIEAIFYFLGLMIDFSKKTKGFCPELFTGLGKILKYIESHFHELVEKDVYLKWIILLLNSMFILIANDVNLDVLIKEIVISMDGISEKIKGENLKKDFLFCLDKIKSASKEAELKSHLTIFKEKPLMKIKQLTPRILDEKKKIFHKETTDQPPLKGRIKALKKQVKINSKKIRKQLIEENVVNAQEKNLKEDHIVRKNWLHYKFSFRI